METTGHGYRMCSPDDFIVGILSYCLSEVITKEDKTNFILEETVVLVELAL
jgi:hypothetical protein